MSNIQIACEIFVYTSNGEDIGMIFRATGISDSYHAPPILDGDKFFDYKASLLSVDHWFLHSWLHYAKLLILLLSAHISASF